MDFSAKKKLYSFKFQKQYLMKLWKLSRLSIHSRQSQQGKDCAGNYIVGAKITEITEHLEKYRVPGTGQAADAEKDYNQESTT